MLKFEIGKRYAMKSLCNQDCEWRYTVVARTSCTVTLKDERGEVKTCRINKVVSKWADTETIYPLGHYSMCPILTAEKTLTYAKKAVNDAQKCYDIAVRLWGETEQQDNNE